MATTIAETRANSEEIRRLRDRNHEFGNELQHVVAGVEQIKGAIDALGVSFNGRISELRAETKEDLTEIKAQTTATNGKVGEHDRQISRLQGGLIVIGALVPVAIFIAPHVQL